MIFARNIVILGKVGSGKKTLGNHIAGGDIFHDEIALDTGNVGAHYGALRREGTFYRILTVDTGSLQAGYNSPVPYIQQKLQEVHSIIFAISHGQKTDESHGSLMHAVESLSQQANSVSALVITHCERMTDKQREAIITEYRDNAGSSQAVAFMQYGAHAVGFPDLSTLPPDEIAILKNAIDRDEEAIRKLVERCRVPLSAKSLPGQAIDKKPCLVASPKYQQQRTEGPTVPAPKTSVNVGLGVSAPKTPVHVGLRASQPKIPGEGVRQTYHRPPATATVSRRALNKKLSGQTVRTRCVVLMGKSGAGKSTVANQLVGHDPLSSYDPPFGVSTKVLASVTREVKHEDVEFTREGILYRVTVIDTVGLFDTSIEGQDPIFDQIEKYFKDYIHGINLILFVFKKGRFTSEGREVFSFIKSKFDAEISPISALAVTGCENDTPNKRVELIQEFQANEHTKTIASQMTMGIHPVGFPPLKTSLPQLQLVYKPQMEQDRDALRDLIITAAKPHLTKKLFVENVKTYGCTIL